MITMANQQEPMVARDMHVFLRIAKDLIGKKHDDAKTWMLLDPRVRRLRMTRG
jgi:hypothetical protein